MNDNHTINGMWVEGRLSLMELLTLASFVDHGHRFLLWTYGGILNNDLPDRVELRDASGIIPASEVFRYKRGPHAGSYAGFSDIFRYKLLYDRGGWWVDMDVTCLKRFNFPEPYVFRPHYLLRVVGNMMKAPRRSPLMGRCYRRAKRAVNEDNEDWHKPVRILERECARPEYRKYLIPREFVTRDEADVFRLATRERKLGDDLYMVHWCNELLRLRGVDKNRPIPGTAYHALLRRHGLI